ncbi:hypothetical protein HPP92_001083 [Vanilla planifolia]|uniref:Protein kinase domain-containing protein n=1 Tax=Vanilla planifolia TaxID=51239 RepID=A0A835VLI6_VANPL|nr:hypothetical protein HPP92_001083 [Vanilla planifolia]
MVRAFRIPVLQELLGIPHVLQLLCYITLLICVQVTSTDLMARCKLDATSMDLLGTPTSGKSAVNCPNLAPASTLPLSASLHLVRRELRNNFLQHASSPSIMFSATPGLGLVTTTDKLSSRPSGLSKPLSQKKQRLAPTTLIVPSPMGDISSSDANDSSVPPSLAEPPISHHAGCCEANMVQRRGTPDCYCVYPVKVELYLWNVSQGSNWSNHFLEGLAAQLNLQVTQFEIVNFYVVGLSGLNITMDIAPITGTSFSADQVHAMNNSLNSHELNVVGGYKVLNFTWFEAPSPSPAKMGSVDTALGEGSLPRPTSTRFLAYEELKEATNNFEPASVLGEGGFGRVFKGVLSDGTLVAIKKLNSDGHQGDREFLVEVEMLSRLHHRNLVKLVGYYSSRNSSQNLLCYELVPNGSLEAWIHGPLGANCPLDWDTRMKIALDAARGLAYLHEDSQPSVIHRDFKSSNILLENNFHAKVSDFGLAKQAPEGRANYLSTRVMGTFGYVAPEYAMTGHLGVKSDVYSYGVVLLELLSGRKPVDMSQPTGQENLVTWARPILRDRDRLHELADPKLEVKYPKEDFFKVCTVAAACVAPEANQRPTMGEVVQSLKMVQPLAEYQDTMPTPSARPNVRHPSTAYDSDGTSSMFSSGPVSGLSVFDNDMSRTAVFSEDLHEGR